MIVLLMFLVMPLISFCHVSGVILFHNKEYVWFQRKQVQALKATKPEAQQKPSEQSAKRRKELINYSIVYTLIQYYFQLSLGF